jgi:uncharacterized protein YndB with AHSA1/START domain
MGRVFEAWSSAELMSRWFVVDPSWTVEATNDFRVGGKYRVEMRRQDGTVFLAFGEYVEISAPRRLVFTWSSAVPAIDRSVVTIELRPVGGATELTLIHENLPDTDEGRAHSVGWEGTLDSLERHLSGETSSRP